MGSVAGAARCEDRISSGEGMVGREILLPGFVVLHETPSPLVSAGVVMVDKVRALFTIAPMNENAQALGRLAKGKPKTLTTEQRKASADRMRAAQKLRWKDKARQEQA